MKVKDIMTTDIISVDKDIDLKYVLKLMEKNEITKIPVLENKKVIGMLTDNNIAYKIGSIRKKGVPPSRMHASSVTDKEIDCTTPDTEIEKLLEKVGKPGPTIICVTDKDNLVGVITKADLLQLVESKKQLREIMHKNIEVVSPDDRIIHARRKIIDTNLARLPVIENGKIIGIISDNEVAFAFAKLKEDFSLGHQKHQLEELIVRDYMKSPVIYTTPNMSIAEAAKLMINKNVGCLPLIENDSLVGIVTRTDLLNTIPR